MDNTTVPSSNATPISTQNVAPSPAQPPQQQKRKSRKILFLVIGFILVVGLGAGLYLIGQQQQERAEAHRTGWVSLPVPNCTKQQGCANDWKFNCKDCDEAGFKPANDINPKQCDKHTNQNKNCTGHFPDNGTVRYKCAFKSGGANTPGKTPQAWVDYWFANGCQTGSPGLTSKQNNQGKVDYDFCGMQQIDRGGSFYSYWDIRRETCKDVQPPPPPPPVVQPTPTFTPTPTPTPPTVCPKPGPLQVEMICPICQ